MGKKGAIKAEWLILSYIIYLTKTLKVELGGGVQKAGLYSGGYWDASCKIVKIVLPSVFYKKYFPDFQVVSIRYSKIFMKFRNKCKRFNYYDKKETR